MFLSYIKTYMSKYKKCQYLNYTMLKTIFYWLVIIPRVVGIRHSG